MAEVLVDYRPLLNRCCLAAIISVSALWSQGAIHCLSLRGPTLKCSQGPTAPHDPMASIMRVWPVWRGVSQFADGGEAHAQWRVP